MPPTTYETDHDARITRIIGADGGVEVVNDYDEYGRVARQELAGSGAVDFAYAEEQGQTTVSHDPSHDPSGDVSVYVHNADYRAVQVTDAPGNISTMEYGPDGRLVQATLPGEGILERVYVDGNLVSSTFGGATTRYGYDEHRRLLKLNNPAGEVTTYTTRATAGRPSPRSRHCRGCRATPMTASAPRRVRRSFQALDWERRSRSSVTAASWRSGRC